MGTKEKTKEQLQKERLAEQQEMERQELLARADQVKRETFSFTDEGVEQNDEAAQLFIDIHADDPKKKFDAYYKLTSFVLRMNLPKGSDNKRVRDVIYEEKNVFLTGKRKRKDGTRGADGRMAQLPVMEELARIVADWANSGASPVEIYNTLRDENTKRGYGTPET